MPLKRGDIVLLPFPYVQNYKKGKTRPVLVIQNNIANEFSPNLIVALISSALPSKAYPMHFLIATDAEPRCGLTKNSIVKSEVIITIPKEAVVRKLGSLSSLAMKSVSECLRISLALD
jgi:mRNA interferase MazF